MDDEENHGILYRAYNCAGKPPAGGCDFAVVDERTGKEVCRVWEEDMALRIALLLDCNEDES